MNRFNIKNRKLLVFSLCLILVCVFALTVAYSALNIVIIISGNASVTSSSWDIKLSNPRVTSGSVTSNVPNIVTTASLDFSTTLNIPGDFYEFTVDVVNNGSIDAMIKNVIKNPELTSEQTKFLKYEITYENGESISSRQLLEKKTKMPIKVRVEYRKDLDNSDLPVNQISLDLGLTLEYVQSDGTGNYVNNNGKAPARITADGSLSTMGTVVTIESEKFYVYGTEGNNVKLLSMYNLYVGGVSSGGVWSAYGSEATGMQHESMKGFVDSGGPYKGVTEFSSNTNYSGSTVERYVLNYKSKLEEFGIKIADARLITKAELNNIFGCDDLYNTCNKQPSFFYSTSYWTMTASGTSYVWRLYSRPEIGTTSYYYKHSMGVRPVILISKDYFQET